MPFGEAPDDNAEDKFGSLIEAVVIFTKYVCVQTINSLHQWFILNLYILSHNRVVSIIQQ
jgi:hypothetical protein